MNAPAKILPVTDDHDTRGFFEGAREGKLMVRVCKDCESGIHPPMAHCPFCGSRNTDWKQASGKGRLHTWTSVERQVHPAYPVPYALVSVELDDIKRVRLVGNVPGTPQLDFDMPMEVFFEPQGEDVVLPNWKPAA